MKKQILFLVMMTTTQLNKQQLNTITTTMKKISLLLLMSFMTLWTAKAQNDITLSCPDDNHPHAIDLGLPSGTLWACCNVGADKPESYGGYYAWGETEEKTTYNLSEYLYYQNGSYLNLGSEIAGSSYDVAHVMWGGSWMMASKAQQDELRENCTYEWTTVNGVKGGKFTSKKNGGTIFLPAAGLRNHDKLYDIGSDGFYWSSTQSTSYTKHAHGLTFRLGEIYWDSYIRESGHTVRPAICESAVANLQLSSPTLTVTEGDMASVDITSGSGSYSVESSNETVATATIQDNAVSVAAVSVGIATIVVTDTKSGQTATVIVTVTICPDSNHPHAIDLGLPSGTLWSCCNVGAKTPEEAGGYYAWGETETKTIYNEGTYNYKANYVSFGSDIAGTEYDVAHVKWGGTWQMPTIDQLKELLNNCTYEWTMENGVMGGKLTSKENGGTIFLPAAGIRMDYSLNTPESFYWSSTQDPASSKGAYYLWFYSNYYDWFNNSRCYGMPVRPIINETNNAIFPKSSSVISNQAVYNVFGIKVADDMEKAGILPSGIYIHGGKKVVVK